MAERLDEMVKRLDEALKSKTYEELDKLFSPVNPELVEKLAEKSPGVREYLDRKAAKKEDVICLTPSLYILKEDAIKDAMEDVIGFIPEGAYRTDFHEYFEMLKPKKEAEKEYKNYMKKNEFGWAAYIARKYNLGEEKVRTAAEKAYNAWIEEGAFLPAASIAREYDLGEEKVRAAAEKGYNARMKEGNFGEATHIASKYLEEDKIYLANVLLGLTESQVK